MRPVVSATSTALGLLLLGAAWVVYEPPVEDVGAVPEATTSMEPAPHDAGPDGFEPFVPHAATLFPEDREAADPPPAPEASAEPAPEPSHPRFDALPARIRVPAIDVDHPLIPVGLNADGSMEIPHDVQQIGWYRVQGVLPGEDGTAVLAGHVDSRAQGPGAFYDLRHLDVGDEVTISDGDLEQEWVVTARRSYDKDLIPIDDIFVDHGAPRLVLITCGGAFDRTARSYRDNIVVYAELR